MKELRITSSFNILPSSKLWEKLYPYNHIKFGDYGDWISSIFDSDNSQLLWIFFLEDLISTENIPSTNNDKIDELLEKTLSPLVRRLQKSDSETLVAWSSWRSSSIIRLTRSESYWGKLSRNLESKLYKIASEFPSLYLIPLDEMFFKYGSNKCFDARNYYASSCRLSIYGIDVMVDTIQSVLYRIEIPPKKVLVLDCDNTLWGGVVGEVGITGIILGNDGIGKSFSDFQRVIKQLSLYGVILTILSKNNEFDVWEVFQNHAGMQINKSDVASWEINWREKSTNIINISKKLNLGLDSFVFWDDNPLEREKMRIALPQVTTIDVPDDTTCWPLLLETLDDFASFSLTSEDLNKSYQYKQYSSFSSELQQVKDELSFLATINLKPVVVNLSNSVLSRAEQLCHKTNQFNLRTIRYSLDSLNNISKNSEYQSFLVGLNDIFGDHGIVGFVIVKKYNEVAFLDTFLISCRVLGRHLENWILSKVIDKLLNIECSFLLAEFIPNNRNAIVESFLLDCGFIPIDEVGIHIQNRLLNAMRLSNKIGKYYYIDLKLAKIPFLEIFKDENK
jgi:FkbH-like protein